MSKIMENLGRARRDEPYNSEVIRELINLYYETGCDVAH